MAYCRFSDGDVYLIGTGGDDEDTFWCCGCILAADDSSIKVNFESHEEALGHLLYHRAHGHDVPADAIERLLEEIQFRQMVTMPRAGMLREVG